MQSMKWWLGLGVAGVALLVSSFFVVDQRQIAVVATPGSTSARVITEPGMQWKWPTPFQRVFVLSKGMLTVRGDAPLAVNTQDKQSLQMSWHAQWRIVQPQHYVGNVGLQEAAGVRQLQALAARVLQQHMERTSWSDWNRDATAWMMNVRADIQNQTADAAKPWGIEVVDIRVESVDVAAAQRQALYQRMEHDRKRSLATVQALGVAESDKIRTDADQQRDVTLANAQRDAQKIKGEADAQAARIYAQSYGRDPKFAHFYRSLEAYKSTLNSKNDVVVINPAHSEFFRVLRQGAGNATATASGK